MKTNLALLFIFILSVSSVLAYECQDNMESWNSPCEVITPVLSSACDASVLNVNNTVMNYSTNISAIGDGTFNFTFNYTDIATYSITLDCDNWATTINLNMGTEEQEPGYNLWLMIVIIFFALLIVGSLYGNYLLIFFSGMYPLLLSIWIFRDGATVYGVDIWWVFPLGWVFLGLGLIIILVSSLKFLEQNEYGYDDEGGEF